MPKVHNFKSLSNEEIYDVTQCDDSIKHGDLIIGADSIVALYEAWPVTLRGNTEGLHGISLTVMEELAESLKLARELPEWEAYAV